MSKTIWILLVAFVMGVALAILACRPSPSAQPPVPLPVPQWLTLDDALPIVNSLNGDPMSKPTLDASWPATAQITNSTALSVAATTPVTLGVNRLLVAVVNADGMVNTGTDPIVVSGLGLVWTKRVENIVGGTVTQIWIAPSAAVLGTGTVTAAVVGPQGQVKMMQLTVGAYTGVLFVAVVPLPVNTAPADGTTIWTMPTDGNWVNVRDYGALGDGSHDDTAAFRTAANTHKKIFVPSTSSFYRTTASVQVFNDVYGDGKMPSIHMTAVTGSSSGQETAFSIFYVQNYRGVDTVTFNGLNLTGGWDGGAAGEYAHGIAVLNSDNILIKYNRIQNCYGDDVFVGGYSGIACRTIMVRNNDLFSSRRCNVASNFSDGLTVRDNYIYKSGTYVSAIDIETDNLGTQSNHNIFIEGNEWNIATQEFNTGALNFTTWANDDHTGPATIQASALRNNFGRWTNTLGGYYPPNNPASPNGLISSPYGYGPIIINTSPTQNGAFLSSDTTPRWTATSTVTAGHAAQNVIGLTGGGTMPDFTTNVLTATAAWGDGVTDQTTNLQTLFDNAFTQGKNVVIPYTAAGYKITAPLLLRTSLAGGLGGVGLSPNIFNNNSPAGFTDQASVIKVTGSYVGWIYNMTLSGPYNPLSTVSASTEDGHCIDIFGCAGMTIQNCTLRTPVGDCVAGRTAGWGGTAANNVIIRNTTFYEPYRCAVAFLNAASNWNIIDNVIQKNNSIAANSNASFVSGIDYETELVGGVGAPVTNVEIAYNKFIMNNTAVNLSRGADGKAIMETVVSGNFNPGGNFYHHNNYGSFGTGFIGTFTASGSFFTNVNNVNNVAGNSIP